MYSVAFHSDGSLCASGGFDAVTRLWDCRTGRNVLTLQGHAYGVLAVAFSANGHHVATGTLPICVALSCAHDIEACGTQLCAAVRRPQHTCVSIECRA